MPLTQLNHMECPHCGANLEKISYNKWSCAYCGATFLDNSAPAQPAPSPVQQPAPKPAPAPVKQNEPDYFGIAQRAAEKYLAGYNADNIILGTAKVHASRGYTSAKTNLRIPVSETCFLLADSGLTGTFKHALALCKGGIYINSEDNGCAFYTWKDFSCRSVVPHKANMLYVGSTSFTIATGRDQIVNTLQETQLQLLLLSTETKPLLDRTPAQYSTILSKHSWCRIFSASSSGLITGADTVHANRRYAKAKVNFDIPSNAKCHMLCDCSALLNCSTGFALCDTGIYYCAKFGPKAGKPGFMSWKEFASSMISIDHSYYINIGKIGFGIYSGDIHDVHANLTRIQSRLYLRA